MRWGSGGSKRLKVHFQRPRKQNENKLKKKLWESWGGKVSPLRVTFSSKSENTTQNQSPTRRPDTGTRGGAVPRKVCCEGAPLASLSSGQFSSGEGARQASLSAPFPAPSWVALSPYPTPDPPPRGATRNRWPLQSILKFKRAGPQLLHASTPPPPLRWILPHVLLPELRQQKGAPPTWAQQSQTTCRAAGPSRN